MSQISFKKIFKEFIYELFAHGKTNQTRVYIYKEWYLKSSN